MLTLPDSMLDALRNSKFLIPRLFRPFCKGLLAKIGFGQFKYSEELNYWRQRFVDGRWTLDNYYEERLLEVAGELNQDFLAAKIVADFGCGPRGSLCWATKAKVRIGLDVLANSYSEFDIAKQNMVYVVCSETHIPLPSDYVDVLFTMNALDHVSNLPAITQELIRIIKPGGQFIGSINLNQPPTFSEPLTLTEAKLDRLFLHAFTPTRREVIKEDTRGRDWGMGILWFVGNKRAPLRECRYRAIQNKNA
jgi:SAM-dependent methyltransferase